MIRRREFLVSALAAGPLAAQTKKTETFSTTASQDKTPRIGVVLSSFGGAEEHDGTKLKRLADPRPATAELSDAQIAAMAGMAMDLGVPRQATLATIIEADDWVVLKTNITSCHGLGPETKDGGAHSRFSPGSVTDLRVVRAVIGHLAGKKLGARFTVAEGSPEWLPKDRSHSPVDGWTTDWGGAFGGLSYQSMLAELGKRFPDIQFDYVDLNFDDTLETALTGKPLAAKNGKGSYHLPKTMQQCDKVISVAPLKTDARTGVSLTIGNYFGIAPGSKYGFPKAKLFDLGDADELVVDLFGLRPADYAVAGGCFGLEGDGSSKRHNLIVAGASALAVDAVGAAAMGFDPAKIRHFLLAEKKGFGIYETDLIWTRGNDVAEARSEFKKPAGWRASGS
ncbi:MAG: DUF362 domain-containing protein [Bryobacteraceae bacterium]